MYLLPFIDPPSPPPPPPPLPTLAPRDLVTSVEPGFVPSKDNFTVEGPRLCDTCVSSGEAP